MSMETTDKNYFDYNDSFSQSQQLNFFNYHPIVQLAFFLSTVNTKPVKIYFDFIYLRYIQHSKQCKNLG